MVAYLAGSFLVFLQVNSMRRSAVEEVSRRGDLPTDECHGEPLRVRLLAARRTGLSSADERGRQGMGKVL